jgi:hypothetical protein
MIRSPPGRAAWDLVVEQLREPHRWNLTISYLIAVAGPLTVGAFRDRTGGFAKHLWLLCGPESQLALTPFLRLRHMART